MWLHTPNIASSILMLAPQLDFKNSVSLVSTRVNFFYACVVTDLGSTQAVSFFGWAASLFNSTAIVVRRLSHCWLYHACWVGRNIQHHTYLTRSWVILDSYSCTVCCSGFEGTCDQAMRNCELGTQLKFPQYVLLHLGFLLRNLMRLPSDIFTSVDHSGSQSFIFTFNQTSRILRNLLGSPYQSHWSPWREPEQEPKVDPTASIILFTRRQLEDVRWGTAHAQSATGIWAGFIFWHTF